MEQEKVIPDGYLEDSQGRLVPIEHIAEIDKARDEIVRELVARARAMQTRLSEFKEGCFDDVEAFVDLSAEKYDVQLGGEKGNVSLTTFDGKLKVLVQVSNRLAFDERIQAAKKIIDECILEWSEGARSEVRALVNLAFKADQQGELNVREVRKLTRLEIDDPRWNKAMKAINDSIQVASSKEYMRFYERDGRDKFRQIPLDLSAV